MSAPVGHVYAVITEDRHRDADIELYLDEATAQARADEIARQNGIPPDQLSLGAWRQLGELNEGLSDSMREAGWVSYETYSIEGDFVRVQRLPLHGADLSAINA